MDSNKETFTTWNKIAKLYEDVFMDLELYNDTYDCFLELILRENTTVLEIGCGPGNITKYMLAKRPDLRITGIDIAPNMIDLAKKNNPAAGFEILDSRNVSSLKTEFDAIIAGFCIPYLSKPDCIQLLQDSANLITDSGVIYLSFVEGNYEKSGFQSGSTGDRVYFYYHSLPFFIKLLQSNKFDKIKTYYKKYTKADKNEEIHTILIAQKTN